MLSSLPIRVSLEREAFAQSVAGAVIWLLAVIVIAPGSAPALLMFGPLVLFPLLLDTWGVSATLRRLGTIAFLPVIASYAYDQSPLAALLTLPWLTFAVTLFVQRFDRHNLIDVAVHGYLIVGASWLTLARLGHRPIDFQHVIVHATAVHFHYAGFVLPILAALLMRAEPRRRRAILLLGLLAGMPLVATGITLAQFGVHWIETSAACLFVALCVWFAIEQGRFALTRHRPLLLVSSAGLITAMSLAALYALRHYLVVDGLSIDFMIRSHGPIQVFGFALPGVVAWSLEHRRDAS